MRITLAPDYCGFAVMDTHLKLQTAEIEWIEGTVSTNREVNN